MARKLYEFLAVTKVDGLPPAPSSGAVTGLVGPKKIDGRIYDFGSVENYVLEF